MPTRALTLSTAFTPSKTIANTGPDLRKSKVKAVIAGDHHGSSTSSDPEKSDLKHIVVGALTKTRAGDGVVNLQTPRFSLLEVYNDDSFEVEEIVLQ